MNITRPRISGTPIQSTSINLLAVGGFERSTMRFLAVAGREGQISMQIRAVKNPATPQLEEVERVDLPRHGRRLIGK